MSREIRTGNFLWEPSNDGQLLTLKVPVYVWVSNQLAGYDEGTHTMMVRASIRRVLQGALNDLENPSPRKPVNKESNRED